MKMLATTLQTLGRLDLGLECLKAETLTQSAKAVADALGPTEGPLRNRLMIGLNLVQSEPFSFQGTDGYPKYVFSARDGVSESLVERLLLAEGSIVGWEYPESERALVAQRTNAALDILRRLNSGLYEALMLVAGSFLFARQGTYHGGSRSAHIGVITFMPQARWSQEQYTTQILHELVHQVLFLHDMVHGVLVTDGDNLSRPEALVTSAILKRPRPYDRSFHSAFVLHAMLRAQDAFGVEIGVPSTEKELLMTVNALMEKQQYLYPFGREMLTQLRNYYSEGV